MTRVINILEETIIAILLAAMTILTFVQVVMRYVFESGFFWAQELTIFMFAWLVLFGMSYGVRAGAHIGVDLLVKKLSPAANKVVGALAIALCMLYAGIMVYGGWGDLDLLIMIGIEAEDLPIPLWTAKIILPLGYALLFLRFAQAGWGLLSGKGTGLHLADEADEAIEHLKHTDDYPHEQSKP